ncbi:MAG: 1-deoxy-D-xylulose 5-phosphate reductoisomerase [Candidatus Izimaplasma bacterium HR2]|nr:MAG: 1-deoxy-D-xylulose 5-phosphate reductoisomerase [Candidatus Izimaplasma bacterium HR2]
MNLYLLGATGSIGVQTLDIVRNNNKFNIVSVSANHNLNKMIDIIEEFNPLFVSMGKLEYIEKLKVLYPSIEFGYGKAGLIKAATYGVNSEDLVVNALVGSAGLEPTIEAIKKKRNIALANKETLVIGGEIIKELLIENNVRLIPVDSEHSAIMQCLNGEDNSTIKRIIITASGGSFRDLSRDELRNVTVNDALDHPNWKMGAKITIDSATMMNKGFEVIEAHYLFDVDYDNIETVLHKESVVHSLVEFKDTSIIAHLGNPDMRVPINYALNYPERTEYKGESLDLIKLGSLHFEELSLKRYPLLKMAIDAGRSKGLNPTTLNAANEACVSLFLNGKIKFLEIEDIVEECLNVFDNDFTVNLDKIIERDLVVKDYVFRKYS